jgi:hypothetical protein
MRCLARRAAFSLGGSPQTAAPLAGKEARCPDARRRLRRLTVNVPVVPLLSRGLT